MPKKSSQSGNESSSENSTLHLQGPNAWATLEELSDKLNRVSAMASVLNVAAFAQSVVLPTEAFQDYTTNLAAELDQVRKIVADISIGRQVAQS